MQQYTSPLRLIFASCANGTMLFMCCHRMCVYLSVCLLQCGIAPERLNVLSVCVYSNTAMSCQFSRCVLLYNVVPAKQICHEYVVKQTVKPTSSECYILGKQLPQHDAEAVDIELDGAWSVDVSPVLRWNVSDSATLWPAVCFGRGIQSPLSKTKVTYLKPHTAPGFHRFVLFYSKPSDEPTYSNLASLSLQKFCSLNSSYVIVHSCIHIMGQSAILQIDRLIDRSISVIIFLNRDEMLYIPVLIYLKVN